MATDTATKPNDTPTKTAAAAKPAEAPKATQAKRTPKPRAKTAAKSRTRKPAATKSAPRAQATTPNGGRQVFAGVVDAQEKTLTAIADYQARAAEVSPIPGVAAIVGAQAQVLRGATDVYVSAARSLLK